MSSSDPNEQQQQLQESFLQQQEKISALKELVRKSGAAHGSSKTAAQEKVKNIAEILLKSKAKSRQGLNASTYSTESSSRDVSFLVQDQNNMLSVSHGQFSQQSPAPSFASTPNPTPSKPQAAKTNETPSSYGSSFSTPGSEKIALMRQQLEQNKLRMAQKASSKQHLEQLVSQLKEKFDSTQQCLEDTTELGRSMSDLSNLIQFTPVSRERHKSATDLSTQNFSLERERIKFLENRCRLLEKQLEKEKQNNQRNTSANISEKSERLELKVNELELVLQEKQKEFEQKAMELREELRKLQNSREITDFKASEENSKLLKENEELKLEIDRLSQDFNSSNVQNDIMLITKENLQLKNELETLRKQLDIFAAGDQETSACSAESADLLKQIDDLKNQLQSFNSNESSESLDLLNENQLLKQETETQLKRIHELNEINDVLETTRCDLTSKCTELQANLIVAQEKLRLSEEKCVQLKDSQITSTPKDTDSLVKSEMANQIQELMDEISEIRSENSKLKESLNIQEKIEINDSSIAEKIANLEACIENQRDDLLKSQELRNKFEEELMEKTIELNVLNANFKVMEEKLESSAKTKPLFSSSSTSNNPEIELENQQLKTKLDESNKAMIKLKLKCKQTEKQIEKLKKGSDLHGEVVKLTKEKDQLQQKVTELEDEKGQWQLTQMETSQGSNKEEEIKEALSKEWQEKLEALEASLKEKENLLITLKQGEQSRVTSELGEIQLEEQVKELNQEVSSLVMDLEYKDKALQSALENIDEIIKEKDEIDKKLERYVNENIELLEKVEKLSKSSSSAESIEIVERLTQQEKQELEEFNNRLGDSIDESPSQKEAVNELTQTEMNPEITDSLNKLREESSELQTKIELFTTERREVLEKMEHLNTENHELLRRIEIMQQEKQGMEAKLAKHLNQHDLLQNQLKATQEEKESLSTQMQEFKIQRNQLSQDITSLQQSSEVVAALDNSETLFEKCETSLLKLHGELEAYRKANDKKSKFNVSKKLAKEAENAYSQLTELLQKVKEASNAVETVTVVETVVAVTASNGKALAEYEQLTAQNRELKATIQELRRLLEEARELNEDQTDNRFSNEVPPAAIKSEEDNKNDKKLRDALQQIEEYELQLNTLQSRVEDLSPDLYEARTGLTEKSDEISQLTEELVGLKKLSEDYRVICDKENAQEKQIDQMNRLRKELESKANSYEHEIQILQTLVKEQKQQLIEAYQEHEHEMNVKLLEFQNKEQNALELKQEIQQLKETFALQGSELTQDLQQECEKLKESLKINKNLVQQQVEELSNKQETIDTLNQQIIDLYKTMDDNANKLIEKEDEISYLQELLDNNKQELMQLEQKQKELLTTNRKLEQLNKQQKQELNEKLEQLLVIPILEKKTLGLEQRNKDQLEKLKKYAANLKKKANQCIEYENKLKLLETQQQTPINSKELEELNIKNSQLQDLLQKTQQNLQQKAQALEEVLNIKSSLEDEILQLKQEVIDKKLALESQEQQSSGWGDNSELETLQEELILIREQLTAKHQEIVELQKSLTTAQSLIEQQQIQLSEANNLRAELQAGQNQIQKLKNDLHQTTQKTADLCDSSGTEKLKQEAQDAHRMVQKLQTDLSTAQQQTSDWGDSLETEQLRLELQNAQITIHKLQTDLLQAQQQPSDWGDSNETEQLRQDLQNAQINIQKLQSDLIAAQHQTSDWGDSNEMEQLREELLCSQENFKLKTREIEELRQSLMAAQEQLTVWGNESSVKTTDYENLTKVLNDKTSKLEKAETTLDELENELMTLREKDHENSLKLQQLTTELAVLKSTQPTQSNQQQALEQKLLEVTEELKAKAIKFEKSKAVIKDRNGQIQRLQAKLKDLQEKLSTCPEEEILSPSTQHQLDASIQQPVRAELEAVNEAFAKLNDKYNSEKANFQETIQRLETLHDGIQAKLQEDMSYIETLELENNKFKNKICRLEECVGCFEERRASMERKVNFMDAQLQSEAEEHTKTEDELIYRLNMLSNHDEVIAQRLIDSQSEKEEIEENFRKLQTEYNLIQAQYQKLEKEFIEYKDETSNDYEQELANLREYISKSESDMERQKAVYDGKLAAKVTELDELECELSEQLENINAEKKQLMERLERTTDECSAHQNDVLRLQENVNTLEQAKSELERESSWLRMQTENSQQDLYELQELRMQCMQDKTEIENLRHQIDSLVSNHESELQALRTQIAELDTLRMQVGQNQTDDQVFIETENKRLTDLLTEKESVIENYQRQNLQLQMAAAAASTSASNQPDPFALAFGLQPQSSSAQQIPAHDNNANELERLNQELQDKNNVIYRTQQDLNNLQIEFNAVLEANQEMQRQLNERQQDVVNRQTLQSVATALTEHQPTDVIPAPPMFFTSETSVRTPFDDLIQPHNIEQPSNEALQEQSPTIEDLQRNVSDLEKHAQDLEHKLAGRNQREFEYEERLREFETRCQEREQQLQQTIAELQKLQTEYAALQLQETELVLLQQQQFEVQTLQQQLHDLRNQVEYFEDALQERDQELNRIKRERLEEEHLKKTMPLLEQQIVPAVDSTILPTLDMFFGNSSAPEFEVFSIPQQSQEPVEEEIIVPKKTYQCQPKESPLANPHDTTLASLDLGEDWGDSWGNSEAAAEAEHFAKQTAATASAQPPSLVPREQQLELQMQDLNERLQELQLSLERSEEQKKELHVKSGKLMKKLKEYKVKIDELQSTTTSNDYRKSVSVESNSIFADLDAAIEEELKRQIKSLEDKLEEQKKQQDTHNIEKEKLLIRIDMLTAGNDRMSDMKERQDMEVQMYQARIRELQEKLTNLDDWGNDDEATKEPAQTKVEQTPLEDQGELNKNTCPNTVRELEQQIASLTLELQDLTGDRLELQALLEEEKVNAAKAEQTLAALRLQLQNFEDIQTAERSAETYQLNNLKIDLQNSQQSYNNLQAINEQLTQDFKIQSETLMLSQTNEKRLQQEEDSLKKEVNNLRDTLNNTKQSLIDLESELSALKEKKEKQIDEASIKEKKQSLDMIQLVEAQKQVLEQRANELIKENEELRSQQTHQSDLQELMAENEHLKNAAFNSTASTSNSTELSALLQERESEILHLKQRINDLMNEDQTEKLVLEILTKNQEIHMLKMQVKHLEEDKHELENNLSLQITNEMQANKEETQTTTEGNARVLQLEVEIEELKAEKKQMEEELQVLNNHVLETLHLEEEMKALTLELDTKKIEISELRKTIDSIKSASTANNTETSTIDFVALNAQWQAIVEQRCGEIAKMWQDHLAQREQDFKNTEERLQDEIDVLRKNQTSNLDIITQPQVLSVETTSSSTPASESTTNSGSTSAVASQEGTPLRIRAADAEANADIIIEKMQAALESQEMEIVTLKEQLAIRSAEYARLAAQYDPFKLHNTSSHSSATSPSETRRPTGTTISDVPMVAKAELDLAMYMLHQRDMRCEEMTLELVNLLEERDTLQLKLSNTLRQMEAIKLQTGGFQDASPIGGAASAALSSTSENLLNTSVAGSTVVNANDDLNQKLSQLQTVSHSKDKVIKEEREQRLRQMEMLQQDVAKMPTAAVSELIGSDLSQSNQSPSNVLLNWLWGNKGNGGGPQPGF